MTLLQTLRTAWRALRLNAMRSFLTMLGVIIGVMAVIAMVAIGEGAKFRVEQTFAGMGANLILVRSGATTSGGARGGYGSLPTLTWDDLRAIRTELTAVRYASAVTRSVTPVSSEAQNWTTVIIGVNAEYFALRSWKARSGQPFTAVEEDGAAKVAVVGQTVVDSLFGPGADPVGQSLRIRNIPFEIVGMLEGKGQSPMGDDQDDAVYIPASTFQSKIEGGLQQFIRGVIVVSAVSSEATGRAERQIQALLRERHRIAPEAENDFSTRNLTDLANASQESTRALTALLASIAAVSLLVGGIGIMNIMLVSVTERTREIGLRMAVGARPRDILAQFLVEALALSLAGGVIGVALGLAVAERLAARFGWPLLIRADMVILAMVFAALVGVVFGLYPAYRASRLNPIEALRYE
jgi:putative ABC transport system permease protein